MPASRLYRPRRWHAGSEPVIAPDQIPKPVLLIWVEERPLEDREGVEPKTVRDNFGRVSGSHDLCDLCWVCRAWNEGSPKEKRAIAIDGPIREPAPSSIGPPAISDNKKTSGRNIDRDRLKDERRSSAI